jgi:hypothetical protein
MGNITSCLSRQGHIHMEFMSPLVHGRDGRDISQSVSRRLYTVKAHGIYGGQSGIWVDFLWVFPFIYQILKPNSVAWMRERTIPTERKQIVGEVGAKFCGQKKPHGQLDGSLRQYSRFSRPEPLLFFQLAPQLYSRWWVDIVPDPLIPRNSKFNSRRYQIFWEVVGLERGPLSLVNTIEELFGWNSSGSGL